MIRILKDHFYRFTPPAACFFLIMLNGMPVLATQGHGGIEGVWVHQIAHLFFLFSMVLLIYWLRRADLVREPGWRYIQYAALFFIFWNIDTILVHFLDEQMLAVGVKTLDDWHIRLTTTGNRDWLARTYYLAKLDHLLCVPAMICLWLGLRHMLKKHPLGQASEDIRR